MLFYKLILIIFYFNLVLSKIIDLDGAMPIAGDVSISPSRFFLKKSFVNRSIRPYLSEQNVEQKLRFTKSLIDLTTPIPFNYPNKSTIRLENENDYLRNDKLILDNLKNENSRNQKSRTNNSRLNRIHLNQDINNSIKNNNEIEQQLDVVTYSSLEDDYKDLKKFYDKFYNQRTKSDNEIDRITRLNEFSKLQYENNAKIRKDRMSENKSNEIKQFNQIKPSKPNNDNKNDYIDNRIKPNKYDNKNDYIDNRIKPIPLNSTIKTNLNRNYYKTIVLDFPNQKNEYSDQYPIKFVEQYRCDVNVSKCGLYNDYQLRDMFYLEYIQNIDKKRRCFVADTSHARKSNQFGARLITQYFHVFGLDNACFELEYLANGSGIKKMEIAQQDSETKVIWTLHDYDISADLSFQKIRKSKIPIQLEKNEPRFFITVNLDPYKIGTIGILGFNFTYSKCDQI